MRRKGIKRVLIGMLAALLLFFLLGLDTRLVVRRYMVKADGLTEPVRIVLLTDFHCCDYGEEQEKLLSAVWAQNPDLVLLGGDWIDDDFGRRPPERGYDVARSLAEKYPTHYVSGNHEVWSGYAEEIKRELLACGVDVLEGESVELTLNGQRICLSGVDDPSIGEEVWEEQMARVQAVGEGYRLLLTHRPERVESYRGFDLILAGHAHGGQWRIPGLLNGLLAPDQGWFPAYAGGSYELEEGIMVVSRGLARETTRVPRFYNRPEIVVIDLVLAD